MYIATGGALAFGVGAALWGLAQPLRPSRSVEQVERVEIPLAEFAEGEQRIIGFRNAPVFVRRLTQGQIAQTQDVAVSHLPDQDARNANLITGAPATPENRLVHDRSDFVVLWGLCPRRGCVPTVDLGDYGGWFCPCYGAHYDVLGRVRKGPSPFNMSIPNYRVSKQGRLILRASYFGKRDDVYDQLINGRPVGS